MVKVFLDGADIEAMEALFSKVSGFTTNPSLLKKRGITDYRSFAREVLLAVKGKPVSFEVLSDDFKEMERQARILNDLGENIYVKIPVTNTQGESSEKLIFKLAPHIKLNITAVMTAHQISTVMRVLHNWTPSIVSIFAGRIMDTGQSARTYFSLAHRTKNQACETLWASPRQVYDLVRAQAMKADIITLTPELIKKLDLTNKSLAEYSLETVKQFHEDSKGIKL